MTIDQPTLHAARRAAGLSIAEAARRAGVSVQMWHKVEDYQYRPDPETLARIWATVGVSE